MDRSTNRDFKSMNFISYAQNFEDVMLWRALKHVENGFYVDIGAQDPLVDSVSLAFYEHGWRGVHVEPTQQYSNKLRSARPDETVLQIAIGDQSGTLTFYEFEDTGLSTADIDIARRHQEAGFRCNETVVPVITLDALLERIDVQAIHWLKLDVEGLEKAVLEGWKNSSILPWVLVIESTRPLTQEESYEEWEQLVLDKGYQYVYFDGLNRFYVSPYHADLAKAFSSPPNVFDGFVLSGTASQPFYKLVEEKAQQAEIKAQQAEIKAQQAETKAQQAETRAIQLQTELNAAHAANHHHWQLAEARAQQIEAIYQSRSWRITAPLRQVSLVVCRLTPNAFKPQIKVLLQHAALYLRRRPWLKNSALRVLYRFPRLKSRLFRVVAGINTPPVPRESVPTDIAHLSPRARQIHADLKAAIERRQKENS